MMYVPKALRPLPDWAFRLAYANIREGVVFAGEPIDGAGYHLFSSPTDNRLQNSPTFNAAGVKVNLVPQQIVQYEGATLVVGYSLCENRPSMGDVMLTTDGQLGLHLFRRHSPILPVNYRNDGAKNWGHVDDHPIPALWQPSKLLGVHAGSTKQAAIAVNQDTGGVSCIIDNGTFLMLGECYEGTKWAWRLDWNSPADFEARCADFPHVTMFRK